MFLALLCFVNGLLSSQSRDCVGCVLLLAYVQNYNILNKGVSSVVDSLAWDPVAHTLQASVLAF